jgi:D-alanyl-D-alanine carboxypeptidase
MASADDNHVLPKKAMNCLGQIAALLFALLITISSVAQPGKYKKIQCYLNRATTDNLAGVVIYIRSPRYGEWTAASGYSNLESKQPINKDDVFSMGSVGKMYNAVAAMKLTEEGKFKLDDRISEYLSPEIVNGLPNGNAITIRHLMGHTSGLINYDTDPELNRLYLGGLLKLDTLSHVNALKRYVFGKKALCIPGAEYHYSSTNYLLLAMIMDRVVAEGHTQYLRKLIGHQGYYRETPTAKNVHYYGDLNQDNILEDLTNQTFETTNWFMGDDGVYAPVEEAAHFLQDLMKGKILSDESLKAMMTWDNEKKPDYGLGLMADKSFPYGFLLGHSGRGIGTTADLYYFPKQEMTVAIFCNTGLRASAPGFKKSYLKMRARIVKKLFLF